MKGLLFIGLASFLIVLSSCAAKNGYIFTDANKAGKLARYKYFIVKESGDTIVGNKFKLRQNYITGNYYCVLDGVRYERESLISYQDKFGLAQKNFNKNVKMFNAIGFESNWICVIRIGKISLYSAVVVSKSIYRDKLGGRSNLLGDRFLISKNPGEMININPLSSIKSYINDNDLALAAFNKIPLKGDIDTKAELDGLLNAIDIYNQ